MGDLVRSVSKRDARHVQMVQSAEKGSVDMVGIALDTSDNIGNFLKQTPVSYPIWRYTGANSRNFMKSYGNNVGVLPFTVVEAPNADTGRPLQER